VLTNNYYVILDEGIEFKVKDISTINENRKIKVSWKLGFMYERYNVAVKSVINEPVTCTLRYKVIYLLFIISYIIRFLKYSNHKFITQLTT